MRFLLLGAILTLCSVGAQSAIRGFYVDRIIQTLIHESDFGECMIKVQPSFSATAPSCGADWVTFSCSGDFNSKSTGRNKYDAAVAAKILGQRLYIEVETTKQHNGYCYATRVDGI